MSVLKDVVAAFVVQRAIQGSCPPATLARRLGIRTTKEINHERFALKALRGDFRDLIPDNQADPQTLQAAERCV